MSTVVSIRGEQLNVRLSPDEMALARRLAEHYGLTPGFLVRMLIREKARELGLEDGGDRKSEPKQKKR
jgi:hypothetical protein